MRLSEDRRLLALSDSGELFLDAIARKIPVGTVIEEDLLEHIGNLLAEAIIQYIVLKRPPQISERLLVSDSLTREHEIDEFWLSGGIAELMRRAPDNPWQFGDIGYYLARGLAGSFRERSLTYHLPEEPIRATVIGAGMHSLQLSGSTISAYAECLPLRNIPLLRPFNSRSLSDNYSNIPPDANFVAAAIKRQLDRLELDWAASPVALILDKLSCTDFPALKSWASALAAGYIKLYGCAPFIVVARDDIAMALGQLLRELLPDQPLVILDGINILDGDFLDVGKPVAGGQALPVVVKSLVFGY